MTENIHSSKREKRKSKPCELELYLQTAVALFISDYAVSLTLWYQPSDRHTRRRSEMIEPCATVHVGADSDYGLMWGVSYISLRLDKAQKLKFFIRTIFPGSEHYSQEDCNAHLFCCTVWTENDWLWFELADRAGKRIRCFRFDRVVLPGTFHPVIREIRKQIRAMREAFIPQQLCC